MKKTLFTLVAFLATVTAFAADNLVAGLTPTVLSSPITPENLAALTDGVHTTAEGDAASFSNNASEDNQITADKPVVFYFDLGETKELGNIVIDWTNACAQVYKIYATATAPADKDAALALTDPIVDETNRTSGGNATYSVAGKSGQFLVFVATQAFNGWGCKMHEFEVLSYEVAVLTSIEITSTKTATLPGNTIQFTGTAKDQSNIAMTATLDWKSSNQTVGTINEAGLFTALTAGTTTITAVSGDVTSNEITITVDETLSPEAAPVPTIDAADVISIYSDTYTTATTGFAVNNWGSSTIYSPVSLGGNEAMSFYDMDWYGLEFGNNIDVSEMKYLHLDIYAKNAATLGIVPIWKNTTTNGIYAEIRKNVTLKAGEWAQIDIDMTDFADASRSEDVVWQLKLDNGNGNYILIDNIYFHKADIEIVKDLVVGGTSEADRKFTYVSGYLTNALKAKLEGDDLKDVTAFDLRDVTIEDGVGTINFANKNAVVLVKGTVEGSVATATDAAKLGETQNLIVRRNDGYYFPVNQLQITDDPESPVYTDYFISGNAAGWKYTRTIPANKYVTVVLPAGLAAIPEDLTVYEYVKYENNELTFNKAAAAADNFPYVVHNTSSSDVDIVITGTNDFNAFRAAGTKTVDGATLTGTYKPVTTDGTQFILQNETSGINFKKANGAKISAFRAYFTGITAATAKAVFVGGETDGIKTINVADIDAAAPAYNLAGQRVDANYKGVVIKNGVKMIQK